MYEPPRISNWTQLFLEGVSYQYFKETYENSEYDKEIPQSQTADKPMAPRGRATQTKQSNQPSLPHQDDCKTRMDIK